MGESLGKDAVEFIGTRFRRNLAGLKTSRLRLPAIERDIRLLDGIEFLSVAFRSEKAVRHRPKLLAVDGCDFAFSKHGFSTSHAVCIAAGAAIRQHRLGKRTVAFAGEMKHTAAMLTETSLQSLPTGLRLDNSGTIRVGRSRVTFDLVVEQFEEGASAEDIVARFTTLDLPSVYSAIAWYLHHREEAAEYLAARGAKSGANREEIERRWPSHGLRERLLVRWEAREREVATP